MAVFSNAKPLQSLTSHTIELLFCAGQRIVCTDESPDEYYSCPEHVSFPDNAALDQSCHSQHLQVKLCTPVLDVY